jgi:hypothetical protein
MKVIVPVRCWTRMSSQQLRAGAVCARWTPRQSGPEEKHRSSWKTSASSVGRRTGT